MANNLKLPKIIKAYKATCTFSTVKARIYKGTYIYPNEVEKYFTQEEFETSIIKKYIRIIR